MNLLNWIILIINGLIAFSLFWSKSFITKYAGKKGENLALKEDLKKITEITETIKTEMNTKQYLFEKNRESKIMCYSKLMGLKFEITQLTQTLYEAEIIAEYYNALYIKLSKNVQHSILAQEQYHRFLELIPLVTKSRRELFATLGETIIAFKENKDIKLVANELYNFKGARIEMNFNLTPINDENDLISWKNNTLTANSRWIENEFDKKIDRMIDIMYQLLNKDNRI